MMKSNLIIFIDSCFRRNDMLELKFYDLMKRAYFILLIFLLFLPVMLSGSNEYDYQYQEQVLRIQRQQLEIQKQLQNRPDLQKYYQNNFPQQQIKPENSIGRTLDKITNLAAGLLSFLPVILILAAVGLIAFKIQSQVGRIKPPGPTFTVLKSHRFFPGVGLSGNKNPQKNTLFPTGSGTGGNQNQQSPTLFPPVNNRFQQAAFSNGPTQNRPAGTSLSSAWLMTEFVLRIDLALYKCSLAQNAYPHRAWLKLIAGRLEALKNNASGALMSGDSPGLVNFLSVEWELEKWGVEFIEIVSAAREIDAFYNENHRSFQA